MTVADLFMSVTFPEAMTALRSFDDSIDEEDFVAAWSAIQDLIPQETEMTVVLAPLGETLEGYDVSGYLPDGDGPWMLEFTTWAEWLGMAVRTEGLDLSAAQQLALILESMTWLGFDEDTIAQVRQVADGEEEALLAQTEVRSLAS